jgi:two-component system, OmpR family, alkaline phosphatase synthesis response regulator PhoP
VAARILLVDDDPGLRLALSDRFESEGYETETAADGDQGLARAAAEPFDVVILDVMLPGKGGFDVCRELRRRGVSTPVLLLSARGQLADRVTGLKLGADDYVVKPFEMAELVARIEARMRSRGASDTAPRTRVRFGNVECDFDRDEVCVDGRAVELSGKELRLLRYLVEHQGATVSRDELLREVWGYTAMPLTRTVDVHVAWLRRKLEPNPRHPRFILTVHGLGYKFVGDRPVSVPQDAALASALE